MDDDRIIKAPKCDEKKLKDEAREVGRSKSLHMITEEDIGKMTYLNAVFKETLRLYPPAPLLAPHESKQDAEVEGRDIKVGTQVIVNAWGIARDPACRSNPEEFQPERFLNSSVDYKGNNFQLVPFGAGRRGCPATQFATALYQLVIAKIVFQFDWVSPNGQTGDTVDMSETVGIVTHRKIPLLESDVN